MTLQFLTPPPLAYSVHESFPSFKKSPPSCNRISETNQSLRCNQQRFFSLPPLSLVSLSEKKTKLQRQGTSTSFVFFFLSPADSMITIPSFQGKMRKKTKRYGYVGGQLIFWLEMRRNKRDSENEVHLLYLLSSGHSGWIWWLELFQPTPIYIC